MLFIWLGALVPMIYLTFLVRRYGVNVPMLDDWEMAPLIVKAHTGGLRFAEIFGQQEEARTIVPKIVFILSSRGAWDVRDQMMLSIVICWLTAGGIFVLLRRLDLNLLALGLCFWLAVLTIFSLAQFELWIFAFGFPSFLIALYVVTGLVTIGAPFSTGMKFLICGALAAASSFTLPHGLLCWGVTFPILFLVQRVPRWPVWLGLWLTLATMCSTLYFFGYEKQGYLPQFAPPAPLLEYVRFVLIFLGSGLANSVTQNRSAVAATFGLLQLLIFLGALVVTAWRIRDRVFLAKVMPWIALGVYSLGSATLAALGRIAFGTEYAASSRYVTFALYLTVAVIVLAAILFRELAARFPGKWMAALALFLSLAYLVPFSKAQANGLYFLRRYSAETRLARAAVLFSPAFDTSKVIQKIAYPPGADRVIRDSAALDALRLIRPGLIRANNVSAVPHQRADGIAVSGSCASMVAEGEFYHATGWALLNSRSRQADCVVIAYELPGAEPTLFSISDSILMEWQIARRFSCADYLWSGWSATFPKNVVPPGAKLSFWAFDVDSPGLFQLSDDSSPETR